jgi:hypothetical protein
MPDIAVPVVDVVVVDCPETKEAIKAIKSVWLHELNEVKLQAAKAGVTATVKANTTPVAIIPILFVLILILFFF